MVYPNNRSVSAGNPQMPDSGNRRIAASGNTGVLKKILIAVSVAILGLSVLSMWRPKIHQPWERHHANSVSVVGNIVYLETR
jgi:hypothetical protein